MRGPEFEMGYAVSSSAELEELADVMESVGQMGHVLLERLQATRA